MKLTGTIAILLLWTSIAGAHPLHLSITNITYENGMLKVSMKTFRDDWETAYFHCHGIQIDLGDPDNRKVPWFDEYLSRSFFIALKEEGEPLAMVTDSVRLDEDSMALGMHCRVPGEPKSLYIYNALLTDIYPDQTNLVIFGHRNRETGIKFDVKKHGHMVMLK